MNTEMQSIWFYSTPKEFRESIYFKILIDNNIEVGINENSFTEMLIRIYENYITILEDGEIGGMYLVDNEIFMDVFNYISCQNTLIAYSKDKIDYLTNRLPKTQTTQPTPPQRITFEHNLNDTQLENLLQLINEIKLFKKELDKSTLIDLLECRLKNEVKTDTTHFAHLLNRLSIKHLITNQYQSIVNKSKLFRGSRDRIITDKNISSTLQKIPNDNEIIDKITKVIDKL